MFIEMKGSIIVRGLAFLLLVAYIFTYTQSDIVNDYSPEGGCLMYMF